MHRCPSCDRFVRAADAVCPFCSTTVRSSTLLKVRNVLAAGATAVVLAACYGPPPGKDDTMDSDMDMDGDSYVIGEDCDDNNADINPGAEEVCDDGVDNDCDGTIDVDDADCTQ